LTAAELEEKFISLARRKLDMGQVEAVLKIINALEEEESLDRLFALLGGRSAPQ